MKSRFLTGLCFAMWSCSAGISCAANLTGEWDFADGGNFVQATTGNSLAITGASPVHSAAVADDAGNSQSGVILTKAGTANFLTMTHGIAPNGGGPKVNKYTLLFDVFSPVASRNQWRSFYQTTLANNDDGDYFITTSNGLGGGGMGYSGVTLIDSSRWKRVVVTVDLGVGIKSYVNGVQVYSHSASSLNGTLSLSPTVLMFADNNAENAAIYVAKMAVWDNALFPVEVAALGAAGDPLASPTDYSSGSFTSVSHGNISGYLLDSDEDNAAVGYDRDAVKAQAAFKVDWPMQRPVGEVANYKIVFKLQDELGNFVPLKAASETGDDGGFEKWVDQNVACPQLAPFTFSVNLTASLVPNVRLSPDRSYTIKAILRKDTGAGYADVVPQPTTTVSSTQKFLHFQNRPASGDAAWNVMSRIQFSPAWDRTNILVTETGQQYHKATVSGQIYRWDEFGLGTTSNVTVPVAFVYRLLDVTNPALPVAVPLLPLNAPPGTVPAETQRVIATPVAVASYVNSTPRFPASVSLPNTTLPVIPADWSQITPLQKFKLEVQLVHGEQNGSEASETTNLTTPEKVITRLSGKMSFGNIDAKISGLIGNIGEPGAPYPQADAANPGWFKSKIFVPTGRGTLPNKPGATWGGQTYFVRYQPATGDLVFIGDVSNPPAFAGVSLTTEAITGVVGNVRFKHNLMDTSNYVWLESTGARGPLKVYYPAGFGVATTERSRLLKGSFVTSAQPLDSFLRPTAATITIPGPFWAVEETKPLRFPTASLSWLVGSGRFDFTASSPPIYVRKLENERLLAAPVDGSMKTKPSNDLIYSTVTAVGNGGLIKVVAASDQSARLECELELGGWNSNNVAHFPHGASVAYSSGYLKIDGDLIHASSRLNDIYTINTPVGSGCADCGNPVFLETKLLELIPQNASPEAAQATFTADGGIQFQGRLAEDNLATAQDIKWGKFGVGLNDYAHRVNGVSQAGFFQPGTFLRGDRVVGGTSSANRPAHLLLAGAATAADGNQEAQPGTTAYTNGVGDYAGLNLRLAGTGLQGQSRLGKSDTTLNYACRDTNKYYIRLGGINGRHEAVPGYVPGTFLVGSGASRYAVQLNRLGIDLLDSDNHGLPSANAGSIQVGGFADFGLDFSKIELGCNGSLGKMFLPPTQPELMLKYWQTGFLPITAEFAPNGQGCDPGDLTLVMGVKAWANYIPEALVGQLGVKPDGSLVTKSSADRPKGFVDSRLQGPPSIRIQGPGTIDGPDFYQTAITGEIYFNNPIQAGASFMATDGFLVFPANVDVSFFPNIPVLVHTSGRASHTPADDARLLYLTGGWAEGVPFHQRGDWSNFDGSERGFPQGSTLADFRNPTTEQAINNYVPEVKQAWLDLADFNFRAGWNPIIRDFEGKAAGLVKLPMIDVRADLQHLTASQANVVMDQELNFTIKPDKNAPFLSAIDLASNFNDALGAKRAAFEEGLRSKLTPDAVTTARNKIRAGLRAFRAMFEDKLDVFGKPSFDPAADLLAKKIVSVLKDGANLSQQLGKSRAEIQNWISATLANATEDIETEINTVIYQKILGPTNEPIAVATEIRKQVNDALDAVNEFEKILAKEDVTTPGGFVESQRHLLRNIARELLKHELATALGNALDQALGQYLGMLEPAFAYVESLLKNIIKPALTSVLAALNTGLGIAEQVKAKLGTVATFIDDLRTKINAEVAAHLALLDFTRGIPLKDMSSAELELRVKQVINDVLKGNALAKHLSTTTKLVLGEPFGLAQEYISDLLNHLSEVVELAIGEKKVSSDGPLAAAFKPYKDAMQGVAGSASLKGYAMMKGDAFDMLRLDGKMKLTPVPNVDFAASGSLQLNRIQGKGSNGCLYAADREWAEAKITIDKVALEGGGGNLGPLTNGAGATGGGMTMSAFLRFTLVENGGNPNAAKTKVVGLNGAFELSPTVAGGGMNLGGATMGGGKLMFAAGAKETFIAGSATMGYTGVGATGGFFLGKSCTLDPIRQFAPDVNKVLGREPINNGPYAGLLMNANASIPLEVLLGIPKTPYADITVKLGASHFVDLQAPAQLGYRNQGAMEGSALGLVRVGMGFEMINRKSLENWWDLHAEGSGDVEVELGSDPFSVTAHIKLTLIYHNGKYDYYLNYPSWIDDFVDLF